MSPVRILLADDHSLVRASLRSLLTDNPAIEVVAEASDGRQALELVGQHRPDLVLMDISMPEMDGLTATRTLTAEVPDVKVLILTASEDEHPRPDTTLEGLAKLNPVFRDGGSVTAGNSSGITDGAAAMVVMSETRAKAEGREPLARIVAWSWAGVPPELMGIGPVPATAKVLDKTGLAITDFDLIEMNEAFAAQVIACERELKFDRDRLNPNGGGISLGHPIGMSGARIILALAYELRATGKSLGLATLCISGGQGLAVVLERP